MNVKLKAKTSNIILAFIDWMDPPALYQMRTLTSKCKKKKQKKIYMEHTNRKNPYKFLRQRPKNDAAWRTPTRLSCTQPNQVFLWNHQLDFRIMRIAMYTWRIKARLTDFYYHIHTLTHTYIHWIMYPLSYSERWNFNKRYWIKRL